MKRILAFVGLVLCLAACAPALETDQARLCRMAAVALAPPAARLTVISQTPDADGRGLVVRFSAAAGGAPQTHALACRFRRAGRPDSSRDLVGATLDGAPLTESRLYVLIRYWLATPEGRAADPAPIGDVADLPVVPHKLAYGLQMAIDGLPLAATYGLLAAAYSLIYGLIGRINFAFGELAAGGGVAAAMAALALAGLAPLPLIAAAFALAVVVGGFWGLGAAHAVFLPLRRASGQQALIATIGVALFLQEALRLSQLDRASWMTPLFNQPFGLVRGGDFVTVATSMTFISAAVTFGVGLMLVALFQRTRWGREWRAYADDPLAAELHGVDPARTMARAFALAGALAGLAGATMTAAFGSVGYGLAPTLTLKALAAAVVGGIGSLPGAFLGGVVIGAAETGWSAFFAIDYRDIAVYGLLAAFIAVRPHGLLGAREPAPLIGAARRS